MSGNSQKVEPFSFQINNLLFITEEDNVNEIISIRFDTILFPKQYSSRPLFLT